MVGTATTFDTSDFDRLWPQTLAAYDLTLGTAEENLALDEALLLAVNHDPTAACLRLWEPKDYFVVLGRSNRAETEVDIGVCESLEIPILRRASGGGTVLLGPGCVCYTIALPVDERHRQLGISEVTSRLMGRTRTGLATHLGEVSVRGTSDLAWGCRKFSGNAQRWLRRSLIHHGTLMYDFNLSMLARCLAQPSRQPEYRQSRDHLEFVTNIPLKADDLREILRSTWNATPSDCPDDFLEQTQQIVESRYRSTDWSR